MYHSRSLFCFVVLLTLSLQAVAPADEAATRKRRQTDLYFPEKDETWESVSPVDVDLDEDALNAALDFTMQRSSSSVVILHRGRILAERHQDAESPSLRYTSTVHGRTAAGHVIEDVASCQKSVTSVLVGIAQEKGLLKITDPASEYLGTGWSNASRPQEDRILIRHLITMTSGLSERLEYVAPAGTRWAYNTTAYSRSLTCVARAAEKTENELTEEWLTAPLGMKDSKWITRRLPRDDSVSANRFGFATSARDLARFGLLMLARGSWQGRQILSDQQYLKDATAPSQQLNPAYGYLWWLNGQDFVLRGRRKVRGFLIPGAPKSLYAAQGALGRKCYVVPTAQLVVVRLGDTPDKPGAPRFDQEFWRLLKQAAPQRRGTR